MKNRTEINAIWKISICFASVIWLSEGSPISGSTLVNVLNAASLDAISYSESSISVADIFSAYPACAASCDASNPCAAASLATQQVCSPSRSFTDSTHQTSSNDINYKFCVNGTVCCHPELCRPRVLKCNYDYHSLRVLFDTQMVFDKGQLQRLAALADDDTLATFMAELEPSNVHNTGCNIKCNGWVYGAVGGNIEPIDCPLSCQCSNMRQAQVVPGGDFVCVLNSTSLPYPMFSAGDPLLTDQFKKVCPKGYSCTNPNQCETYEEYQAKVAQRAQMIQQAVEIAPVEKPVTAKGSEASSSRSISGGAIAGIVIGSVVGLVIISAVVIIAVRKRMDNDPAVSDHEDDQSEHYSNGHYMPM